ncbi:hydroxyacid dehydrogenase [Flavobacteriaceae bacterium Ap0902]|nr:hydroxyacid dehydrogenase [Flavobacteriaceae bacterium Ap0902]
MKILILDQNHPILIDKLKAYHFKIEQDYTSSKAEIENKIAEYDGLIIRSRFTIDKVFIEQAENLKFIGRVGAGMENIDTAHAESKNILLFNAPEGNRDAVGEHCLGMLLSIMNNFRVADAEVRNGIWQREENRGEEIMGKTVALIGYGNMGKAFAKKLQGFDANVICYDIKDGVGDENCRQTTMDEVYQTADILSLHIPQTPMTLGLVNEDYLAQFQKPIYLVNTARGKSVVTTALVKALQSGKVKAAGLDVLEYEKTSFEQLHLETLPKALDYLLQSNRVLLTPHIAGWTHESKIKLAEVIANKIIQYFG